MAAKSEEEGLQRKEYQGGDPIEERRKREREIM